MFSFRTELDLIKKVKSNPYEFEAQRFLEEALKSLKDLDVSELMQIETLDFNHKCINDEDHISVLINKEYTLISKRYSHKISKELFEAIEKVVSRGYWVSAECGCSFSLKF